MKDRVTIDDIRNINSPMIVQYIEFKDKYKDYVMFFQIGDFYEAYCEDAELMNKMLDLKLTSRTISQIDIPMCGVPSHTCYQFANELAKRGKSVVIISQRKEEEKVIRELTDVITPATIVDEQYLQKDEHQYIMTLYNYKDELGVAILDYLSGEVITRMVKKYNIFDVIYRYQPKEVYLYLIQEWEPELMNKINNLQIVKTFVLPYFYKEMKEVIQKHKEEFFQNFVPYTVIAAHYFLISHINEIKNSSITLRSVNYIDERDYLYLHSSAIINLDLLKNTQTNSKKGSLFELLDKCTTPKGSRMLKKWIEEPLMDSKKITSRYEAIEFFLSNKELRLNLQQLLIDTTDIERTLARFETNKFKDNELVTLLTTLKSYYSFIELINDNVNIPWMKNTAFKVLNTLQTVINDLETKIDTVDIIKQGYNIGFDTVKKQKLEGKRIIEEYYEEEKSNTGIKALKLDENKILGYFFEVTPSNYNLVPSHFIERSNLSNKKRYVTEKLKELEQTYNDALESYDALYKNTIKNIIYEIKYYFSTIRTIIDFVSLIDILMGFAELSERYHYKRPTIVNEDIIDIKNGYHPLLQAFSYRKVISNDCVLSNKDIQIITGPNMGGKSTYLKMVGMIVIMAQVGCFVPAQLKFKPVDRILVRIGANDSLLNDQSTFMMEMEEVAYIVYHATKDSLILMDELGRGTSTEDGIAIAKSVLSYIHNNIEAKTICSTHYHEMIELEEQIDSVSNYHADVIETEEGIDFTFKIVRGGIPRSFGIEVAKKAGLPKQIIEQAELLLNK